MKFENSILNQEQQNILNLIMQDRNITDNFYLGGGTALAEFYLKHRLSEDLDFFSEQEFDPQFVSVFFQKIKKQANIESVEIQQSFNRNLFLLRIKQEKSKSEKDEIFLDIKTEFTYYPFERIEKKMQIGNLQIDSLTDIAVNKVFTIYQKPRSRDFIDLFCILQHDKKIKIEDLIKMAQVKFGQYIESLQFAAQCQRAETLQDYPTIIIDLKKEIWINYFLELAKKMAELQISE